ncbi:MAG: HD family phosphohydrolase [Bacteroidaceae bacterium]
MKTDKKACREEFVALLRETGREGVDDVISDLDEQGFFDAPASAGHHLNVEGGLAKHSLNTCKAALAVWEGMKALDESVAREVPRQSVVIASLLHDVCKTDIYVRSVKKRKNALGGWEDVEGYRVTYRNFPFGHGEKSVVMLLCSGLELTDAEMMAIRWHMGAWGINMNSYEDQRCYDTSRMLYPLVAIVQAADGLAASVLERTGEETDEL